MLKFSSSDHSFGAVLLQPSRFGLVCMSWGRGQYLCLSQGESKPMQLLLWPMEIMRLSYLKTASHWKNLIGFFSAPSLQWIIFFLICFWVIDGSLWESNVHYAPLPQERAPLCIYPEFSMQLNWVQLWESVNPRLRTAVLASPYLAACHSPETYPGWPPLGMDWKT